MPGGWAHRAGSSTCAGSHTADEEPRLPGLLPASELDPGVAETGVRRFARVVAIAGGEQVEPHGAMLRTERVEHRRDDLTAHEHQGGELQDLGLPGTVSSA